ERVDQSHVDRRETANVPHINAEIEAVGIWSFNEDAQRRGVGRAVNHLKELLVLEAVYDPEKPFARARWHNGLRAIDDCQTLGEGFPCRCGGLTIPTKEPADEKTDVEERAHDGCWCEQTRACRPQKLIQR